ncbi:hypothetical protein C1X05_07190 [Laceyella sacchari]|nr:hypothetical protein C1X05_07190 [Laceyella sacchari]
MYDPREQFRFQHHKLFWISMGAAYVLGKLLIFWYIILILIVLPLVGKAFEKFISEKYDILQSRFLLLRC